MKLLLVRHGDADYSIVMERHHVSMGCDMAHLSALGEAQAKEVAKNPIFKDADIIISSPYTRAMQTASYIMRETGLDIIVENDLHEWTPDLTFRRRRVNFKRIDDEMEKRKGKWDPFCFYKWETPDQLGERAFNVIRKYLGKYNKIIVVAHGLVFNQFIFNPVMKNCEIEEYEFDENSKPLGFISRRNK